MISFVTAVEDRGRIARTILDNLPDWFGIPTSVDAYVEGVKSCQMIVYRDAGTVIGFLSLKHQTPAACEAYVLGVLPDWHRRGIGRALFAAAEAHLVDESYRYLTVKTLSADRPDPNYEKTRKFYNGIGFEPIEVFPDLWGSDNPCLVMIKQLGQEQRA